MGQKLKQENDRRSNRTSSRNNKRTDRRVESNNSPEVSDSGETSEIPGLTSGYHLI